MWTKFRNLDEILDEIGYFGRTKNGILDKYFLCVPIKRPKFVFSRGFALDPAGGVHDAPADP